MRATHRGYAAIAVIVLSIGLGWLFGARSLNAVAAPPLAALLLGVVRVHWADDPSIEISEISPGFPGETRNLSLSLQGSGLATITVGLPRGVTEPTIERTVALPHTIEYELELDNRGIYTIGPSAVTLRDPLGLVERQTETTAETELTVYPQRYALADNSVLDRLFTDELEAERQEFDKLREYTPGDPLRRIHWKSSAKRDDFVVMEFSPEERTETMTIAANSQPGGADEMARAAITIAEEALNAGLDVELAAPDEWLPPGQGEIHREGILRLLARVQSGSASEGMVERADIVIQVNSENQTPGPETTTVEIANNEYTLQQLLSSDPPTATMEAPT